MGNRYCQLFVVLLAMGVCLHGTAGVVFGQFSTVINIPPDAVPSGIGSDTQLNLGDGGTLGWNFDAGSPAGTSFNVEVNVSGGSIPLYFDAYNGSTINIYEGSIEKLFDAHNGSTVNVFGGSLGEMFSALSGSVVNISGGNFGRIFRARPNSEVNISGGSFGDRIETHAGSTVELLGGNFQVDGELIGGLGSVGNLVQFNLPDGSVLSGTLSNGTAFAFSNQDDDDFRSESIADGTIYLNATDLPPVGPPIVTLPDDALPVSIRAGQTLVVNNGGVVGDNFNVDWGGTVIVDGGQLGNNFEAVGAHVTILDGTVERHFDAFYGSTVDIMGGTVGASFDASNGSVVNISGGYVERYFTAKSGSVVNITGGTISDSFEALGGSVVNVSGGSVGYSIGDPAGGGIGARDGSTVNVSGGTIRGLAAYQNSILNITGGAVEHGIGAYFNSNINISGGAFDGGFSVFNDSTINVSSDVIMSGDCTVQYGSILNLRGGTLANGVRVRNGGVANISGGIANTQSRVHGESRINLSGGAVDSLYAYDNGEIDIFGSQFILDGIDITALLTTNVAFPIADRDVSLTGLLADGSAFSFDLNSTFFSGEDYFDVGALLNLTLVAPGDFDVDLDVDGNDFLRWQSGFGGIYDEDDFADWEGNFGMAAPAVSVVVPEPGSAAQVTFLFSLLLIRRGRRRSR